MTHKPRSSVTSGPASCIRSCKFRSAPEMQVCACIRGVITAWLPPGVPSWPPALRERGPAR